MQPIFIWNLKELFIFVGISIINTMNHSCQLGIFIFLCLWDEFMGRVLYFSSYSLRHTWIVGIIFYFLTIATAFPGYVLPRGQTSFWGTTVITNLISAIPYIVLSIWGGWPIENAMLTRFHSSHFILHFIIIIIVIIHLLFLHQTGSSNRLGTNRNIDKISL